MIHKTNDYSMFKHLKENRSLDPRIVKEKIKILVTRNKMKTNPIQVTKDFYIIDGQHRFEACKLLGLDVYYIVDEDFMPMDLQVLNNSTNKWDSKDYIKFFAEQGNKNYQDIRRICSENGIVISDFFVYTKCDGDKTYINLRNGQMENKFSEEHIINLHRLVTKTIEIIQNRYIGKCSFLFGHVFKRSLVKLFTHPDFKENTWFNNLEKNISKVYVCAGTNQYIRMLISIYNHAGKTNRLVYEDFLSKYNRGVQY